MLQEIDDIIDDDDEDNDDEEDEDDSDRDSGGGGGRGRGGGGGRSSDHLSGYLPPHSIRSSTFIGQLLL